MTCAWRVRGVCMACAWRVHVHDHLKEEQQEPDDKHSRHGLVRLHSDAYERGDADEEEQEAEREESGHDRLADEGGHLGCVRQAMRCAFGVRERAWTCLCSVVCTVRMRPPARQAVVHVQCMCQSAQVQHMCSDVQ